MKDKSKSMVANMTKKSGRVVKARLTKRSQSRLKQFARKAEALVDDVEVGKKSFPDNTVRKAMRALIGALEEHLETIAAVAEAAGEDDIVEILEDAAGDLSSFDSGENDEDEEGHEEENENNEESENEDVDINIDNDEDASETILDESGMYGY